MQSATLRPLIVLAAMTAVLFACADKPRQATGIMDSPEHHYGVGMGALDRGDVAQAAREFDLALQLDPEYGPALAGKGLALVSSGGELDRGQDLVEQGRREAESDAEKLEADKAAVRLWIEAADRGLISREKMVDKAEKAWSRGELVDPQNPGLDFWMGEALLQGLEFEKAETYFARVRASDRKAGPRRYAERADERWELLQKAKRAAPGSLVGRKMVLVDRITRADMAGLLVEELNVRRFYERTRVYEQSTFQTPEQSAQNADAVPSDIAGHPLRSDIETVVELGVQGLGVGPDGAFHPDEPLARAEVALILQDIIVRATGQQELATEFIGQKSPFVDVRSDHPYFNAVMLVTTRGLMRADRLSGRFLPAEPVAGVDALLSIKELKDDLNPF